MNLYCKQPFDSVVCRVGLCKILKSIFSTKISVIDIVTTSKHSPAAPNSVILISDLPYPLPAVHGPSRPEGSGSVILYRTGQRWAEFHSGQGKTLSRLILLNGSVGSFEAWSGCIHWAKREIWPEANPAEKPNLTLLSPKGKEAQSHLPQDFSQEPVHPNLRFNKFGFGLALENISINPEHSGDCDLSVFFWSIINYLSRDLFDTVMCCCSPSMAISSTSLFIPGLNLMSSSTL